MAQGKHSNLTEMFQGDVNSKLDKNIISADFQTLPCNCRSRQTSGCNYNDECRKCLVVYEIKCKHTGKSYIGATQQHLKKRCQQHIREARKTHAGQGNFDTFSSHMASMARNFPNPSPTLIRNFCDFNVLWQGNPFTVIKTFGTNQCILCNQERLQIYKWMKKKPHLLINRRSELYGTCRHKPRFHRFIHASSSADESSMDERVHRYVEV